MRRCPRHALERCVEPARPAVQDAGVGETKRDRRPDCRQLRDGLRGRHGIGNERPCPGSESVAVTRRSKPVRSSRSRIETTSPCDSSSMSNSSAPTAATPSTPSEARAGWRTRLRHANPIAFIGGPACRPLRRSSAHDATTVAETPSGTAIATQMAATSGVTRTKISAVS